MNLIFELYYRLRQVFCRHPYVITGGVYRILGGVECWRCHKWIDHTTPKVKEGKE